MVFMSSISYAQNCDCSSNLKWLIETFEKNDAGFQYVIDRKGENTYLSHNNIYIEEVSKIKDNTKCLTLLNDWTEFFRENHLQVVVNQTTNSPQKPKELSGKEIIKQYEKSPKFIINDKEFENYISHLKIKNNFEGIWLSEPYTIGIVKDEKNPNRDFVGFIVNSKSPYWQKNQIKLEIDQVDVGKFDMKYYMRDHSVREFKNIDLVGNKLIADFIILNKLKPEIKSDPKIESFIKSMFTNKPHIQKTSDNTLLLRIPSFRYNMKKEIDSLLLTNSELISKTDFLIIDLRNNGGGFDPSYEKIIPYLYTNPVRALGVQFLSTELNNKINMDIINNPKRSKEEKERAKIDLEKLNKNIGKFVNLANRIVDIGTLDTILPYPKSIGILINENCGSTTEQFLLMAKQSKKVKLFGRTTLGSLDISNVNSVNSPCGKFKLLYGITKSYRIPELVIDGNGISPDFYFDQTIKQYEWVEKTEEILNYK